MMRTKWILILAILVSAFLKTWLVLTNSVPFNSDEAIVALMARHILKGAKPIFFYGQSYMGSLDPFLVALGFYFFGEQVWVIRLVQIILYAGIILSSYWLSKIIFSSEQTALLAACLLAIPSVNITLYTIASLGGYGEALLIGNMILIMALFVARPYPHSRLVKSFQWLGFGLLTGFGFWVFGLTLVYSIPAFVYVLWINISRIKDRSSRWIDLAKGMLQYVLGCGIGAVPIILFTLNHGFHQLFSELSGGAIAGVEKSYWILTIFRHIVNLLLFGSTVSMGIRPPWEIRWLILPAVPFVIFFWMLVVVHFFWKKEKDVSTNRSFNLIAGVFLLFVLVFILTPFGADPSGRYFLPIGVLALMVAADFLVTYKANLKHWVWIIVALLLSYNLATNMQLAKRNPPGLTTQFDKVTQINHQYDQALIDFLEENNEKLGYTNYWVTYPLAFLSAEKIIFVPRLPYHQDFRYTSRDDRIPSYDDLVNTAPKVAYITTNHPDLDIYLRDHFLDKQITWSERVIGDYHVFYALSRAIRPEEIGLGRTTSIEGSSN